MESFPLSLSNYLGNSDNKQFKIFCGMTCWSAKGTVNQTINKISYFQTKTSRLKTVCYMPKDGYFSQNRFFDNLNVFI